MTQAIENLLREERSFPPSAEFAAAANAQPGIHDAADEDFIAFWLRNARERVSWFKEPIVALDDSNPPFYRWFTDGESQPLVQLPGSAPGRAGRQGRLPLGGRTRRDA